MKLFIVLLFETSPPPPRFILKYQPDISLVFPLIDETRILTLSLLAPNELIPAVELGVHINESTLSISFAMLIAPISPSFAELVEIRSFGHSSLLIKGGGHEIVHSYIYDFLNYFMFK